MSVYFITGKMGAGKSLVAIGRMRDYLMRGKLVATNMDVHIGDLVGNPNCKSPRVIRLKDKPDNLDFGRLPIANDIKNNGEKENGLMVLDEAGTWLNSRTWNQDKAARQEFLDWLVQTRKRGWDILLICQNIKQIDSQARDSIAEHVVFCKRADRATLPIIGPILKIFHITIKLPRIHVGVVVYDGQVVDRWVYRGTDLFNAYDTNQIYNQFCEHEFHSLVPPGYLKIRRDPRPMNWSNLMKVVKIYLKKFNRIKLMAIAALVSGFISFQTQAHKVEQARVQNERYREVFSQLVERGDVTENYSVVSRPVQTAYVNDQPEQENQDFSDLDDLPFFSMKITGSMKMGSEYYYFIDSRNGISNSHEFEQAGYKIIPRGKCEFVYRNKLDSFDRGVVTCETVRTI